MVANTVIDARFSQMSLAVAKDSGWYQIDLGLADQFFWGKDEGCDMFQAECSKVSEFCSSLEESGCSDNHMYITQCFDSYFASECHLNINILSCKRHHSSDILSFSFGADSVCLPTKVTFYRTRVDM